MEKHLWKYVLILLAAASLIIGCSAGSAAVPVTGLSVSPQVSAINTHTGPWTLQLTATVTPSDATDKRVLWISTDTSKATVDARGLVTAAPGQNATVFIIVQSFSGAHALTCTVTLN